MEATDGVKLELSNGGLEKALTTDVLGSNLNMENKTTINGENASEVNEVPNGTLEDQLQADVGHVYEMGIKDSSAISENKVSNLSKKSGAGKGNNLKNTKAQKVQKDGAGQNGAVIAPKNPKARLSQSLSFPAKSSHVSSLRKCTTAVKHTKLNDNSLNANDSEIVSTGGTTARKSNNWAAESTQRFLPVNSVSADDHTSEATLSISPRTAVQRRSAPVFSFRLDERAERRKEFFMKLEEKVHAKELENTNLQAKSKENQEAEIRQLRKSLTFKATPMPNFYQEASPPKVELKKIPPTRARSPKLGRNKQSSAAANNSLEEGNDSAQTHEIEPFSVKQNGGAANAHDSAAPKKAAIHKSITRLPPQKSAVARPDAKLPASKTKASNTKEKAEKVKAEENENKSENEIKQVEESPADAQIKIEEEVAEKEAEREIIISSFLMTSGEVPTEA